MAQDSQPQEGQPGTEGGAMTSDEYRQQVSLIAFEKLFDFRTREFTHDMQPSHATTAAAIATDVRTSTDAVCAAMDEPVKPTIVPLRLRPEGGAWVWQAHLLDYWFERTAMRFMGDHDAREEAEAWLSTASKRLGINFKPKWVKDAELDEPATVGPADVLAVLYDAKVQAAKENNYPLRAALRDSMCSISAAMETENGEEKGK